MNRLDKEYGRLEIHLGELIEKKGLNRNQIAIRAAMNWKQVDKYCDNNISRLDVHALCKLCTVLECGINELLVFIPANKEQDE